MIFIDQRDRRPIYEQIVDKLSDLMARAILKQDDPLPSVRTLATELSINPNSAPISSWNVRAISTLSKGAEALSQICRKSRQANGKPSFWSSSSW